MERVKYNRVEVSHGNTSKKFPVYEIYLDGVISVANKAFEEYFGEIKETLIFFIISYTYLIFLHVIKIILYTCRFYKYNSAFYLIFLYFSTNTKYSISFY